MLDTIGCGGAGGKERGEVSTRRTWLTGQSREEECISEEDETHCVAELSLESTDRDILNKGELSK